MDEASAIAAARAGDQLAWETLVRAHQEPVFRLAYLMLGDAAEAEDAAQDAFIRALNAVDRFDTSRPLRPWLLRIVANTARNRRRSQARYRNALERVSGGLRSLWRRGGTLRPSETSVIAAPPSEIGRAAPASPAEPPDILGTVVASERARLLWEATRRLGPADREIIYLRFFLELSVDETAGALGVARGTVKSRLHRALARLRTVVENDFPELGEERGHERGAVARPG